MAFRRWIVDGSSSTNRPQGSRPGLQALNTVPVDYPSMTEALKLPVDGFFKYLQRSSYSYDTLELAKRDGSVRYLSSPAPNLRKFQYKLLKSHLSDPALAHESAFAYLRGKSAVQCARVHEDANWLLKIDLVDFFHSIDERQIYREFRRRGVQKYRSFVLARMLTRSPKDFEGVLPRKYSRHRRHWLSKKFEVEDKRLGFLPQGAPTSGAVSNLVSFNLDVELADISERSHLRYTRYADDIIISGSGDFDRASAEATFLEVRKVVERAGFRVNIEKTRIIPPGARMKVLGVLVGGPGLRLPREKRVLVDRDLRAIEKFGFKKHSHRLRLKNDYTLMNRLYGNLIWAHEVNPDWAGPRLAKLKSLILSQLGDIKGMA